MHSTVADPGFPVGGRQPHRGGANSRGSNISKNVYAKMKESGTVGGARRRRPLDPPLLKIGYNYMYFTDVNIRLTRYYWCLQTQSFYDVFFSCLQHLPPCDITMS